jgi:hypothetical protein
MKRIARRIVNIESYLNRIFEEKPKKSSIKRLYRGQSAPLPLKPKLFRDETLTADEIEQIEESLLRAFRTRSPYLLPSTPSTEMDTMSLAQHYGLPTRLLDWTANPLVALFFAVEGSHPKEPTVWIYHVGQKQISDGLSESVNKEPRKAKSTTVIEPKRHSTRVAAQAGWHTVHRFHTVKDGQRKIWALDHINYHRDRISVIKIHPASAAAIRAELKDMGIDDGTVYGDLNSVCNAITKELAPSGMW